MLSRVILEEFGTVNSPLCTAAPPKAKEKHKACNVWAKSLENFAEFLPLPNVAHLPASGTLKVD